MQDDAPDIAGRIGPPSIPPPTDDEYIAATIRRAMKSTTDISKADDDSYEGTFDRHIAWLMVSDEIRRRGLTRQFVRVLLGGMRAANLPKDDAVFSACCASEKELCLAAGQVLFPNGLP